MSMKLSLLHKGLLLVSIPLCFEIAVFSVLISMQDQVEREAQELDHKRRVNECVNTIIQDLARVGGLKKHFQQQGNASATKMIRGYFDDVSANLAKLEDLTKDDEELRGPVQISKRAVNDARNEFTSVRTQVQNASSMEDVNQIMIASRRKLDGFLQTALEAGLLDLAVKTGQGADLDNNMVEARQHIAVMLRYAVGVSVLLALTLAVLYSRNQALRIMRVKENTVRFANRDNLLTVLRGDDEIAQLDKAFHEAARQIEVAHRKETAILENATDLILSLDEELLIKSINQSSKNTIGKQPEQIVNQPLSSLVFTEDATMLNQSLKQLIQSTTHRAELEVRLLREDDEPLNMIVSAKYSPRDQTYYCIMHDVTTQREIEKLRREVVAMITHDLRTPLGTIKIFMEMQKDGMLGELNERGVRLLELADRESKRMSTLLDGVLTLEKIRSGNMTLEPVAIDLFDLLNSCSQALALIAQEKKIQIELKPFDKISIKGDRVWLEQVVINIVSNALKFSPEGSQVTLGGRCVEGRLAEITIADQGPGVPEADRLKIFERFHRVTATSHKVGHGLGLSICKDLILLHNGSISCESTQGKGCTFIILLPLAED